jgi:hypothetical protein
MLGMAWYYGMLRRIIVDLADAACQPSRTG